MASFSFSTSSVEAAVVPNAMVSSGSSSSPSPAPVAAVIEPTASMDDKEAEERRLLLEKMAQVQDVALDTKFEKMKVEFDLGDIRRRQYMERWWMETRVTWDRALIARSSSPSAPYFNGCPPLLRGNLRCEDLSMTMIYDSVMEVEPVNLQLHAALCKIGPVGLKSEQLKRKWAPQEEELSSNVAKRSKMMTAVMKKYSPVECLQLQEDNSELLDDDDDDGKLSDVKRLDKEILSMTSNKVGWRRRSKESYEWYYPLTELSSREEHLTSLAEWLAERADARGTALPTESEVIGCMLLDLLATSAMSPSASATFFPAP